MLNNINNYLLKIEYDGSNFVGWQFQENGKSIQETIEKAIFKVLKSKTKSYWSWKDRQRSTRNRTAYANFKINQKRLLMKKKILNSINFFLNKSLISILEIKKMNINFHSRHQCKRKNL